MVCKSTLSCIESYRTGEVSINSFSSKLDAIENNLRPVLKPLKFRRGRRLFTRTQADGILHVIHFQMGPNWSIYHGKFTVELGVFVPEVYEAFWQKAPPRRVASYHCEERKRLGVLSENGRDLWWDLSGDAWAIGKEVLHWILAFAEPYFSQYSSRIKLVDTWEQERIQKKLSERKILAMAILLAQSGDRTRARELLESEYGGRRQTAFLQYARNIIAAQDMDFPMLKP